MTIYQPFDQEIGGGRLFVHTKTNPYALVPPITQIIRVAVGRPAGREAPRRSRTSARKCWRRIG